MAATHTIRTTVQPAAEITVSHDEYERLLEMGLIFDGTPPNPVADALDARVAERVSDADSATRAALSALGIGDGGAPADGSITPAKLSFDPATQAELDALGASTTTALANKVNTSTYTAGLALKANTADLAAVAQTGSYNDLANKPTIPTAYTDEQAQDAAALLLTTGTHTGVTAAYDDAAGKVNLTVTGGGSADLSGVPTLEELDRVISLGAVNATAVRRLGPASFDQRIGGLSIAVGATVAASDTDYWTVSMLRLRSGTNPLTVTTRTTKTTGGAAFTADQGWNFDAMSWLETARHLRKGDVLALAFTKTGAPADLADVSVSIRYEPGIVPLIRDTFTRTDSTSSLGVTDTGQAYEAPLAGTLGIAGGQGYAAVLDGGAAYVLLDAGRSDYTVSIKITESGQALVFRATNYDNLFELGAGGVSKFQAGAYSSLIANPGGVAANDVLSVAVSGPSLSAYKNGVLLGTISDAFNQTATRIGLGTVNTTGRFDDLELAT